MPAKKKKANDYTVHNEVEIIRGGAAYFNLIEEIANRARYTLYLQTYIYDEDDTGRRIADALIRAAKRSVTVYVLLDGYASQHLSKQFIQNLEDAGIRFAFFMPVMKSNSFYIGRRLHHKVLVADGYECLVAGINISNRYNDIGETKAWLDWAVHAKGEIGQKLNEVCIRTWNRSVFRRKCTARSIPSQSLPLEECLVRVRRNDWVYEKTEITRSYRELFDNARSSVIVMTSYFWPPERLLKKMGRAARRGVKVKLILTATADVPFAKYAERYLYRWLFRNNVEVYEYQKNILHAKIAVADGQVLTVGSYNVNNISAFASVELNLDINNAAIANQVQAKLEDIIKSDCEQIDRVNFWTSSNIVRRLQFYLSFKIVHMIFFLFTFYFIQRRERD